MHKIMNQYSNIKTMNIALEVTEIKLEAGLLLLALFHGLGSVSNGKVKLQCYRLCFYYKCCTKIVINPGYYLYTICTV